MVSGDSLPCIHCLMEIEIEIERPQFVLRALNDTKSAFLSIEMDESDFSHFMIKESLNSFACKVPIKVCIAPVGFIQHFESPHFYAANMYSI